MPFTFSLVEGRQGLPRDDWPMPSLLLWATILYIILVPIALLLSRFEFNTFALAITVGLALFSVASSDFEALTRCPSGRVVAAMAFIIGYILTIICTYFAIIIVLYITIP